LSVAAGVEFLLGKATIFSTIEWFQALSEYDIIKPTDRETIRPKSEKYGRSALTFLGIRQEAMSVLNMGIGFSVPITKKFEFFSSYRTDNSYKPKHAPSVGRDISLLNWNLWHVTAGVVAKQKRSDLSVGINFGYASLITQQVANISEPKEKLYLQGEVNTTNSTFLSPSLILGYTYHFRD
jgi:hypothetical protein